ncbi:DsbA family protein [Gaopeijia maritima]|uniref:DsbA family protein n=1 Tax=Gaopeijia maritima TaxID=3119007 RepID=A0ABU9E4S5_9BACT
MRSPRSFLFPVAAALCVAAIAACGSESSQPAVDSTTADLLAARQAGQVEERPSAGAGAAVMLDTLGYDVGDPEAPVRMVEFSDFGCGYCRTFHMDVWPTIEREYVATGKVYWKYVPMILGRFSNAREAAMAGECAGVQGRFTPMSDLLFGEQSSWKDGGDPDPVLESMAERAGVDMAQWRECVANDARADRIDAGTQVSRQVGVRGTPTFFIMGYAPLPGALPLDLFREVLDTAYAQAMRDQAAGTP